MSVPIAEDERLDVAGLAALGGITKPAAQRLLDEGRTTLWRSDAVRYFDALKRRAPLPGERWPPRGRRVTRMVEPEQGDGTTGRDDESEGEG